MRRQPYHHGSDEDPDRLRESQIQMAVCTPEGPAGCVLAPAWSEEKASEGIVTALSKAKLRSPRMISWRQCDVGMCSDTTCQDLDQEDRQLSASE